MNKILSAIVFAICLLSPMLALADFDLSHFYENALSAPSAQVVNTIPIQSIPAGGNAGAQDVQVNTKTNRVYVSNQNSVTVLDGNTDAIIADFAIPAAIVVNPISTYSGIYQSCVDDQTNTIYTLSESGIVTIIDGASNSISGTFSPWPQETVAAVDGIVCNPETGKLYMILYHPLQINGNYVPNIVVWDIRKQHIAATLNISQNPHEWMAVNRKTNRIYAQTIFDGLVVIDGNTDKVIDRITAGVGPLPAGCLLTNSCDSFGSHLGQVAVDENTNRVYVVGLNDGSLTTIDGATDKVLALDFNNWFSYSLALDPARNSIYQMDIALNNVSVIDGASGKRSVNLTVGSGPFPLGCANGDAVLNPNAACIVSQTLGNLQGAAVNPNTGKLYVTYTGAYYFNPSGSNAYSYVFVLKPNETQLPGVTAEDTPQSPKASLVATETLGVGAGAVDATINTRTNTLYIANSGTNNVSVFNPVNGMINATIPTGASPRAITVNEAANMLYTFNGDGSVSVLDSIRNQLVANFPVDANASGLLGLNPQGLAYSQKTGKLYAVNGFTQIDVINPNTQHLVTVIPDVDAGSIAINQVTNTLYVSQFSDGTVWVIDGATDRKIGVIQGVGTPSQPSACYQSAGGPNSCIEMSSGLTKIAVDEMLNRIYVIGQNDGRVVTIDGDSNEVLGTNYVQPADYGLTVDSKEHTVYVSNFATPALWLLDGVTGQLGEQVNFNSRLCDTAPDYLGPTAPSCFSQTDVKSVTVNPDTGDIFVLDQGDLNPQNTSLVYLVRKLGQ